MNLWCQVRGPAGHRPEMVLSIERWTLTSTDDVGEAEMGDEVGWDEVVIEFGVDDVDKHDQIRDYGQNWNYAIYSNVFTITRSKNAFMLTSY